jgi:glyoxylase I family protein
VITTTFSHVALNCADQAQTERFYTRYFGFRRSRVVDLGGSQIIFLKSGTTHLELFAAEKGGPVPVSTKDGPTTAGVRHIAFQVPNVDAKLTELGREARVTQGPFKFDDFIPGWKTVWITDPDGNIVEISQGFVDQSESELRTAALVAS